jgi:hypothetical protein
MYVVMPKILATNVASICTGIRPVELRSNSGRTPTQSITFRLGRRDGALGLRGNRAVPGMQTFANDGNPVGEISLLAGILRVRIQSVKVPIGRK